MTRLNIVEEFPKTAVPVWVKRLEENERIEVLFLGQKWLKIMIHWNGMWKPKGRTEACTKPTSECPWHAQNMPLRGKAYMHVYNLTVKDEQFLELPPGGLEDLERYFRKPDSYRGIQAFVKRGRGKKARVSCETGYFVPSSQQGPMPVELSPWISLAPLYRMRVSEVEIVDHEDFSLLAS